AVTFTAVVSAVAPGVGVPTGNVDFLVDGVAQVPSVALAGGTATFTISTLAVGNRVITVNYLGTPDFAPNTGTLAGGQDVLAADSAVAVSSSVNPSVFGQPVTFTATVSAVAPSGGTPSGNVDFLIDGAVAASNVALVGGQAAYTTNSLSASATGHVITVHYLGSTNFGSATGALTQNQVVNTTNTTTAVS